MVTSRPCAVLEDWRPSSVVIGPFDAPNVCITSWYVIATRNCEVREQVLWRSSWVVRQLIAATAKNDKRQSYVTCFSIKRTWAQCSSLSEQIFQLKLAGVDLPAEHAVFQNLEIVHI
jgi:hypothetical protein